MRDEMRLPKETETINAAPTAPEVFVAGATGFVGQRLTAKLLAQGVMVRCGSRTHAPAKWGGTRWVRVDLLRPETVLGALQGSTSAVYLMHGMGDGAGYAERERQAAETFAWAAEEAGLERIVYLGGVVPDGDVGKLSPHLKSRLETGDILRRGKVPVFELRAAMVIGEGSASFQIVRDLAFRLPVMLLPRWMGSRSAPVAIDDVVRALHGALTLPIGRAGTYNVPGPEVLAARDMVLRTAKIRGFHPKTLDVPFVTPRLSSYWLKLVTSSPYPVARELVAGLATDLLPSGNSIWDQLPPHPLTSFDDAVRAALIPAKAGPIAGTVASRWPFPRRRKGPKA